MSNENGTQLPISLDINSWIQFSLASNSEVTKQIALEELSANGVSPYIIATIREMSARDKFSSCRELASWVEKLDNAKFEVKRQLKGIEASPQNLQLFLDEANAAEASIVTSFIRKAPPENILQEWRQNIANHLNASNDSTNSNSKMLQIGLTILGKFGIQEDAQLAVPFLSSPDAETFISALSLLQLRDMVLFRQNIKFGLTSKSIKIQLQAVHLLKKLDLDESVTYLEAFLRSKNSLVRQKALREIMLIPFDHVEHIFLQYIGRETEPLLLIKAGLTVASNPSPELPLKLYDILLLSNGDKRFILDLIIKQMVEAIHSSGILTVSIDNYINDLKQKLDLRRSEITIKNAIRDLQSKDTSTRHLAIERLIPFQHFPSVKEFLNKQAKQEKDKEIQLTIETEKSYAEVDPEVSVNTSLNAKDVKSIANIEDFLKATAKHQRNFFSSMRKLDKFTENKETLLKILSEGDAKGNILSALRILNLYGIKSDAKYIKPFLQHKDTAVQAGAIRAIGKVDIDNLLPLLNQFLVSKDIRIKSAALEIYVKTDKEAAIQYLASMLSATSANTRKTALSLLPLIDYPSIESLLWKLLEREPNLQLKTQVVFMIATNPTIKGIQKIYSVVHKSDGSLKSECHKMWEIAITSAHNSLGKEREELEDECKLHFQKEIEQQSKEKSDYSYISLIEKPSVKKTDKNELLKHIADNLWEFKRLYITVVVLAMPLIWKIMSVGNVVTSKSEVKRRLNKIASSNFVGRSQSSDSNSQVGNADWDGTLKSNATKILSADAYSRAISEGKLERQKFTDQIKQRRKQYFVDLYNNEKEDTLTRMMAAAQLNSSFVKGQEDFQSGNLSNAEYNLMKVINDPQANTLAKVMACQTMLQIVSQKGRQADFPKWMDRMGKLLFQIKELKGFENLKDFSKTYSSLLKVSSSINSNKADINEAFKKAGMKQDDINQRIKSLSNMRLEN